MRLTYAILTLSLLAGAMSFSCTDDGPESPSTDSETHWLQDCAADDDCSDGYSCHCGTCADPCELGRSCAFGATAGACLSFFTVDAVCAADDPGGVCAPQCQVDSDCAGNTPQLVCSQGVCQPPSWLNNATPGNNTPANNTPANNTPANNTPANNTPANNTPGPVACAEDATCLPTEYCERVTADCAGTGVCTPRPEDCTTEVAEVCGCDGVTYGNACAAASAGVSVAASEACAEPANCGGFAGLECEMDEMCVYPIGMCQVADGFGACLPAVDACTEEFDPVCGCDGTTYGNSCSAQLVGASVDFVGECP